MKLERRSELVLSGVALEDGPARFDSLRAADPQDDPSDGSHSTFKVVLHEGRNREVRRLWNAVGFEVSRLLRIRYGPIELPRGMRPGTSRRIEGELLEQLGHSAADAKAVKAPSKPAAGVRGLRRPPRRGPQAGRGPRGRRPPSK